MKRLAIALAALFLLRADMYPDASNAKLPEARINLGIPTSALDIGFVGDGATAPITTTAGSTTFTPALPATSIGKAIIVPGAGTNGDPLVTTIATASSFAAPAVLASSPTTFYADKGAPCPVETPQSGAGSYVPGDTVTLSNGVACLVSYTQIVGTPTIVNGGSGCTDGTNLILTGTTGGSHFSNFGRFRLFATASGGAITVITAVWWSGRYLSNPTNLADEPVIGGTCTGVRVAIPKMGVAHAQVNQPGGASAIPVDPVAQTSTSGAGTGARFNMTTRWRAAGVAHYGTDNTSAVVSLAAATNSPYVYFSAGTYLFRCGNYSMASAVSLVGDGIGRSNLKLFPYCGRTTGLLSWENKHGVTIERMTFDASRSYNTSSSTFQNVIVANGGANFRFHSNSIINVQPRGIGLLMNSYVDLQMLNPVIRDSYFHLLPSDGIPHNAVLVSNSGGATAGILGGSIVNNYAEGGGIVFCLDGGVVSGNQVTGQGYGTGIYIPQASLCRNTLIKDNIARDSVLITDVDLTTVSGFEINGDNIQLTGNLAYRNAGNGYRMMTSNGFISGNTAWGNNKYTAVAALFPTQASGFMALGPNANGSTFLGNNAYDGGEGTQSYGYSENGTGLTVSLLNNNFRGVAGPIGARVSGSVAPATTVANLPACNASTKYLEQPVSDQNGVPTYRGALTGGGALAALAFCNGTAWEAH